MTRGIVRACKPCRGKGAVFTCRHCGARLCTHRAVEVDPMTSTACCAKCKRKPFKASA